MKKAHLPHRRRGLRGQDQEHSRAHRVRGQVLLGDPVLALPALADDRHLVGRSPRLHPAGEPAGHPHQVRVVQLLIGAAVQSAPPGPEPARVVPQREVGVEHDPVHAVIRAGQQIAVPGAEYISHPPTVGRADPSRQPAAPKGPPVPGEVPEPA
jgi:hypothetical protein